MRFLQTILLLPLISVTTFAQADDLLGLPLEPGDTGTVYKVVEQMPLYPYCDDDPDMSYPDRKACAEKLITDFIYSTLEYPPKALKKEIEGWAIIKFIIERDGRITSASILRDPGEGTGEEALRIVDIMAWEVAPWNPGYKQGVPVRVEFNLPVKFKLD